jgi:putative endonuclease
MADFFRSPPRRTERKALDEGARAETLAARFLASHGLAIVARNFRTRMGEIDIVARDREMLVFVEVRKRRSAAYGGAIASITGAKRTRLIAAAKAYLAMIGKEPPCRFDAVLIDGAALSPRIEWQRDIFDAE